MRTCNLFIRYILIGLCLLGGYSSLIAQEEKSVNNVGSLDELIQFVQGSNLRSDTEESKGFIFHEETGGLELTLDFLVDSVISFGSNQAIKRIYGAGVLYRANGDNDTKSYDGTLVEIGAGVELTFEVTIDGQNVATQEPDIIVKEGGSLTYKGIMKNLLHSAASGIQLVGSKAPAIYIYNGGNMSMESGSISCNENDIYSSAIKNEGTLTLRSGSITGGIDNANHIILNDYGAAMPPMSVDYIQDKKPGTGLISIASLLHYKYEIKRYIGVATSGHPATYFFAGDIIAQGTGNYQVTAQDAEKLILSTNLKKVVEGNQIVLREETEFDLQAQIDAATGTATNPTVITIPEAGINLSEQITIKDKHVKITGGTIKADFSKIEWPHFIMLESGTLIMENITLDGNKETAEAADKRFCSFLHINGGVCYLKKGFVLQNVLSHWDFYNPLLINGGVCYMEEGARIQMNKCTLGGTVAVYKEGRFILQGGYIYANEDGHNGATNEDLQFGTVYVQGNMEFQSGNVSHDYVSIGVAGNLLYTSSTKTSQDAIKILKGGTITLVSSLTKKVDILLDDTRYSDSYRPKIGDVIVKGTDSYQLTEKDLVFLIMPEGYSLKLQDNTFVLAQKEESGKIGSLQDLIDAVSAAPTGSASNPTELYISTAALDFDQTLEINGKHIKLTGNGVIYQNVLTTSLCLFKITNGGSLTIEGGAIYGTKSGTNVCNTAIYVSAGCTVTLNNVSIQRFISDLSTWSMLRIYGTCYLNNCMISDNNGKAMIYVGYNGLCRITGGKIQNNSCSDGKIVSSLIYNQGQLEYVSGEYTDNHAISFSSFGTLTLSSPHIQNYLSESIRNEGSIIYNYRILNLYNTANIGDAFYLGKSNNQQGYINLCNTLKKELELVCHDVENGWVAFKGLNYTLTQADLQKIVLAKALAAEYTLQKVDNTFVLKAKNSSSDKYKVTVEACKNGTLTTDKTTAAKGELVTITAKPATGYKLYTDQLCYNRFYQLQTVAGVQNTFTFNMPSTNAHVEAEFIPDKVDVKPLDQSPFDPDKDITPGKGFGNLDSLIAIVGDPDEIIPEGKPVPDDQLSDILRGEIEEATDKGDEHYGSLEDLITIVSDGIRSICYKTPCKLRLTFTLPNNLLRASADNKFYILNESEGKITTIIPEYDAESNTLTFETDKLGIFAVLRSNSSSTANAEVEQPIRAWSEGNTLHVYTAERATIRIYTFSGQLYKAVTGSGEQQFFGMPDGHYIIQVKDRIFKMAF